MTIPWTETIIGTVIGYVGGGIIGHPKLGALVGAGAGYYYGGGTIPNPLAALSGGSSGSGTLQVPNTTVTSGT
jgi:hypothetical protein